MQPLCRARLKNGFLLAAHLEFYRIYFWGLNGHITGPEICLNLNFISSPRRPHLSPCHDLPAPISQCDFFSLSPLTTYRRNHISVHPLSVWGSMQVWEGDHVGYNECHSFLFDIYFYYIVVQKKNVPSDVFEAIHQGLDGICFFNSWEFIFSSAAGVRAPVSCLQDCHRLTFSYS